MAYSKIRNKIIRAVTRGAPLVSPRRARLTPSPSPLLPAEPRTTRRRRPARRRPREGRPPGRAHRRQSRVRRARSHHVPRVRPRPTHPLTPAAAARVRARRFVFPGGDDTVRGVATRVVLGSGGETRSNPATRRRRRRTRRRRRRRRRARRRVGVGSLPLPPTLIFPECFVSPDLEELRADIAEGFSAAADRFVPRCASSRRRRGGDAPAFPWLARSTSCFGSQDRVSERRAREEIRGFFAATNEDVTVLDMESVKQRVLIATDHERRLHTVSFRGTTNLTNVVQNIRLSSNPVRVRTPRERRTVLSGAFSGLETAAGTPRRTRTAAAGAVRSTRTIRTSAIPRLERVRPRNRATRMHRSPSHAPRLSPRRARVSRRPRRTFGPDTPCNSRDTASAARWRWRWRCCTRVGRRRHQGCHLRRAEIRSEGDARRRRGTQRPPRRAEGRHHPSVPMSRPFVRKPLRHLGEGIMLDNDAPGRYAPLAKEWGVAGILWRQRAHSFGKRRGRRRGVPDAGCRRRGVPTRVPTWVPTSATVPTRPGTCSCPRTTRTIPDDAERRVRRGRFYAARRRLAKLRAALREARRRATSPRRRETRTRTESETEETAPVRIPSRTASRRTAPSPSLGVGGVPTLRSRACLERRRGVGAGGGGVGQRAARDGRNGHRPLRRRRGRTLRQSRRDGGRRGRGGGGGGDGVGTRHQPRDGGEGDGAPAAAGARSSPTGTGTGTGMSFLGATSRESVVSGTAGGDANANLREGPTIFQTLWKLRSMDAESRMEKLESPPHASLRRRRRGGDGGWARADVHRGRVFGRGRGRRRLGHVRRGRRRDDAGGVSSWMTWSR